MINKSFWSGPITWLAKPPGRVGVSPGWIWVLLLKLSPSHFWSQSGNNYILSTDLVQPPKGFVSISAASKGSISTWFFFQVFFRRRKSFFSQFSRGFSELALNSQLSSPRPSPVSPEWNQIIPLVRYNLWPWMSQVIVLALHSILFIFTCSQ